MNKKNVATRLYRRKLYALTKVRETLAKKIDESYIKSNISELLALEAEYQRVVQHIAYIHRQLSSIAVSTA